MKKNLLYLGFILTSVIATSCSTSDDIKTEANNEDNGKGSVLSLNIGTAQTRVTESTDATNYLKTSWESTDKLDVFHNFTKTGSSAFGKLEFVTSEAKIDASGVATFNYLGGSGLYSYTNGTSNLLAILKTANITSSISGSNALITMSNFAGQDGTLAGMKDYDVMYGSTGVTNGVAGNMTMNHLTSVVIFKLSGLPANTTFTKVEFACASTTKSILPASGTVTVAVNGTVSSQTYTAATKWTTGTIVSDASGNAGSGDI